jgi:hypothetical protein
MQIHYQRSAARWNGALSQARCSASFGMAGSPFALSVCDRLQSQWWEACHDRIPIIDLVFDGKDDYIEIPDDLQFSVATTRPVKRGSRVRLRMIAALSRILPADQN